MSNNYSFVLVLLCFCITSCITNKDVVYLQENGDVENDSVLLKELIKPYRVQIGDILRISVKALDKELTEIFNPSDAGVQSTSQSDLYFTGFTIDMHGNIEFPILGEINVLGHTLDEIEEKVKSLLLEKYFKETAQVFVVVKLSGLRYVVSGEVVKPGTLTLFQDRVNIIEALANSGDVLPTGDRKDVLVVRQYPQGQKIHHIDLTTVDAVNSPCYFVRPNDMIIVKPLKRKALGAGQTAIQSISTVASVFSVLISTYFLVKNL